MLKRLAAFGVLVTLCVATRSFAGPAFDLVYAVGEFGIGREAFDGPVDVVEDRDENIFVVDQRNNRIQVLDRRGRFVREWGTRGFSPGSFDAPAAIALDSATGSLFVVDKMNHRIQKFDPTGKLLAVFGKLGSGDGEFNNPMDVAIDKKGNIYVADTGNNRVQKLDASGRFIAEWGRFSRSRRGLELNDPVSVAVSDEGLGHLYAISSGCAVQKFDINDGRLVESWPMHQKGEGASCGPSRIRIEPRRYTVYIADAGNDRVVIFDKDGESLGVLKDGKGPLKKPAGLFINQTFGENVIVADTGNHIIQKFRRVR